MTAEIRFGKVEVVIVGPVRAAPECYVSGVVKDGTLV